MTETLRGGTGRKPKFHVGQVVCAVGLEPKAFVKLVSYDPDDEQWNTSEGYFSDEELRPLTPREKGKS